MDIQYSRCASLCDAPPTNSKKSKLACSHGGSSKNVRMMTCCSLVALLDLQGYVERPSNCQNYLSKQLLSPQPKWHPVNLTWANLEWHIAALLPTSSYSILSHLKVHHIVVMMGPIASNCFWCHTFASSQGFYRWYTKVIRHLKVIHQRCIALHSNSNTSSESLYA